MGEARQIATEEADGPSGPSGDPSRLSRSEWVLLLVLGAVQFTHIIDFMIVMPLEPHYERELAITPGQFGLVVAVYGFSASTSSLLVARFLDRFDRKHVLLVLYSGFTIGTLLCAAAPTLPLLVLARTVTGAFGGVVAAMTLAVVGDVIPGPRRGRATGVVLSAFSVASIVGVPSGLFLANFLGWRAPFVVVGLLGMVVIALVHFVLPPIRGHLDRRDEEGLATTWAILTEPTHVRAYVLMVSLVMSSFTIVPFLAAYLEYNVGRSDAELPFVYFFGGLTTLWTMNYFGRLSDRFGKLSVFRILALFTIVPILLITNLPPVPLVAALGATTLFYITTSGRMVPATAMITACTAPRNRGSFMSVNSSVQQMALGLASLVAGAIVGKTPEGALTHYEVVGALAAIATLISVILAGRLRVAAGGLEAVVRLDVPAAVE